MGLARVTVSQARWSALIGFASLWPAWVRQFRYGVESFPLGLVLLVTVFVWWGIEQRQVRGSGDGSGGFWLAAWLGLLVYSLTWGRITPLGSQVFATMIVGCLLVSAFPFVSSGTRIAYVAVLPLTLPLEMALQFVLGFPFRRVSAELAGALLSVYGVTVKGTTIYCGGNPLEVDAACSGVLGLWTFVIIGALLSLVLRHRWPRLLLTLTTAAMASLVYNVLRTSMLFMYRFHAGAESHTMHTALGATAFLLAVVPFVWMVGSRLKPIPASSNECCAT